MGGRQKSCTSLLYLAPKFPMRAFTASLLLSVADAEDPMDYYESTINGSVLNVCIMLLLAHHHVPSPAINLPQTYITITYLNQYR